jgi:hypothetical protein
VAISRLKDYSTKVTLTGQNRSKQQKLSLALGAICHKTVFAITSSFRLTARCTKANTVTGNMNEIRAYWCKRLKTQE